METRPIPGRQCQVTDTLASQEVVVVRWSGAELGRITEDGVVEIVDMSRRGVLVRLREGAVFVVIDKHGAIPNVHFPAARPAYQSF